MMSLGASMVSKPQPEFKGLPDYLVTPKWLFHINEDGEFRPALGLLEKLWGHKVVVNLIESEHFLQGIHSFSFLHAIDFALCTILLLCHRGCSKRGAMGGGDGRNTPGRKIFYLSSRGGHAKRPKKKFWKVPGGRGARSARRKIFHKVL